MFLILLISSLCTQKQNFTYHSHITHTKKHLRIVCLQDANLLLERIVLLGAQLNSLLQAVHVLLLALATHVRRLLVANLSSHQLQQLLFILEKKKHYILKQSRNREHLLLSEACELAA